MPCFGARAPRSANRKQAAPGHLWKSISSRGNSRIWVNVLPRYGGFFEYDRKQERLEEVARELEDPAVWSNPARPQDVGGEAPRATSSAMHSASRPRCGTWS